MTKPSIQGIPRYRALFNTFRFLRDPLGLINDNIQQFGTTFHTYLGGIHEGLVTVDAEFIQHVLQKNHRKYRKSPMHFDKLSHFLGNGLLTSEGEYWLRQRRLIQPGFHRARLAALTEIMQQVIDDFIFKFDTEISSGKPVDIASRMMELAFNIVARSLFSTNLEEAELRQLAQNITILQEFIIKEIRQPYLNGWRKFSGALREHEKISEEFKQLILKMIHERRASDETQDDLLQMLLDARYEDTGEAMNDQQLFEECAILFVAGHETSANALAWTWYLLAQHQDVVQQARAELTRVLGDRKPTFEDLPKLEYLTQIIEESMRLYPPAWITDRIAAENDEWNGIPIKKGMVVVTYFYGAHHSPKYWQNPEQFDPERFSKENKKQHIPFAYSPFGGGPRLCIGNNFAMMEMQLVLAALLRRYDFELIPDQIVEPQPLITLRPKNGIWMQWKSK
ncbi:MAG: cytochrome P450 [Saprospiraceae bacterium]